MDFKKVLEVDSSRFIANMVVTGINNNPEYFDEVYRLCFESKYPINMRAGRAIALICEKYPDLFTPYLNETIGRIKDEKTDGVKRGFLKAFTESVPIQQLLELPLAGLLVNCCFDWLISPSEPIAVKVYSMELLEKVCKFEPELTNELIAVLENISEEQGIAVKNSGKKILKRIRK